MLRQSSEDWTSKNVIDHQLDTLYLANCRNQITRQFTGYVTQHNYDADLYGLPLDGFGVDAVAYGNGSGRDRQVH